jgi:hypothetical protein
LGQKLQIHSAFFELNAIICLLNSNYFSSGPRETAITGHSVWSHDAHVVMKDTSHLNLIAMGLLQTCGYITEQMQTAVTIDVNKFLGSFSIKADGGRSIHPPTWIPGEDNSVTFSPSTALIPNSQSSSSTAIPKPFTMENYSQCRQAEAIRWIDLQEKRASIMARLHPVKPEEYQERRDAVYSNSGPLRRKGMKIFIQHHYGKYNVLITYFYSSKTYNTHSKVPN